MLMCLGGVAHLKQSWTMGDCKIWTELLYTQRMVQAQVQQDIMCPTAQATGKSWLEELCTLKWALLLRCYVGQRVYFHSLGGSLAWNHHIVFMPHIISFSWVWMWLTSNRQNMTLQRADQRTLYPPSWAPFLLCLLQGNPAAMLWAALWEVPYGNLSLIKSQWKTMACQHQADVISWGLYKAVRGVGKQIYPGWPMNWLPSSQSSQWCPAKFP